METLIEAEIFFYISSIASIVLTVLLSIALFYFIKAGKNLYYISEKLQDHFKESEEFILDMKERLENNVIFRMFFSSARRKKREKEKAEKKK